MGHMHVMSKQSHVRLQNLYKLTENIFIFYYIILTETFNKITFLPFNLFAFSFHYHLHLFALIITLFCYSYFSFLMYTASVYVFAFSNSFKILYLSLGSVKTIFLFIRSKK